MRTDYRTAQQDPDDGKIDSPTDLSGPSTATDVLAADGYLLGSTANFG